MSPNRMDDSTERHGYGSDGGVTDEPDQIPMNYRESLTVQAFNQMERLKMRIDRQEYTDQIKRKRQYCRVTEPLKQT